MDEAAGSNANKTGANTIIGDSFDAVNAVSPQTANSAAGTAGTGGSR